MRACFTGQQSRVGRERLERRADEFGRTQRGHSGLGRRHPDRRTQQHDLLVLLREPPRRGPLRTTVEPPDAPQLLRIHAPFCAP